MQFTKKKKNYFTFGIEVMKFSFATLIKKFFYYFRLLWNTEEYDNPEKFQQLLAAV